MTNGGDGFHSKVDPRDPNTVYTESQYGGLIRFDRKTGERVGIQPQEGKGEAVLRWNWDSPLLLSPHSNTRLYFAANKLFRSDDRGDSWKAVSGDLTKQVDRDRIPVMEKVWGPDAVAKNQSTSLYSNCTALSESPKKDGVLFVGTDDGIINAADDGGATWRKVESFATVPEHTYVSRILASQHDVKTVYAAFDNHKNSDFAPYLLRSTDGRTWTSLKGNLPANGPVLAIAEDPINSRMLFVGTEFGIYFTLDGGGRWVQLKGGMPTVAVRNLAVQRRESNLVVATLGRGIHVLDDYSSLRGISAEVLNREAVLFSVRDAVMYIPSRQYGMREKAFQGESLYTADNPPMGGVITYYLKDGLKTMKEIRREAEKAARKAGKQIQYPAMEALREEDQEEKPLILLSISDNSGHLVKTGVGPADRGFHRVAWDLRGPAALLSKPRGGDEENLFSEDPDGPLVLPGKYQVTLSKRVNGLETRLAGPRAFQVTAEGTSAVVAADLAESVGFQQNLLKLQRAVSVAQDLAAGAGTQLEAIMRALDMTPAAQEKLRAEARSLRHMLSAILIVLKGDESARKRNEAAPVSISDRVSTMVDDQRLSTARPTKTHIEQYEIASELFGAELTKLRTLVESDLKSLEKGLEAAGGPPTPGRFPGWRR